MSHGLKSLAKELPKYGRYDDDMVAHISSDEAKLLKSLGGSGTINPTTGLPEFGWNPVKAVTQVFKPVQQAVAAINPFNPGSALSKGIDQIPVIGGVNRALNNIGTQVFQPLEKAIVQPASRGLADFDKAVGQAVPGGWGTVGMVAASMIPGMQPLTMAGLGAINGSGVLRKGGNFNLQGAMMGGAMAYGMSSLAQYAQGAVPTTGGVEGSAGSTFNALPGEIADDAIGSLNASQGWTGPNVQAPSSIPSGAIDAANLAQSGSSVGASGVNAATGQVGSGLAGNASSMVPPPSIGSNIMAGNFGDAASQIGTNISEGISGLGNKAVNAYDALGTKAVNAYDALTTPETYSNFASDYAANVSKTGEGIKNLVGLGDTTASAASKLASASTGINPMTAAAGTIYAGMGLAALEEQRKYLEEAKVAQTITDTEYNNALAEIERSTEDARRAVRESPFSTTPSRDVSIGDTYYGRTDSDKNLYARNVDPYEKVYAVGGSVDDEYGMDEARGLNQGNLQNGLFAGGIPSYADGGMMPSFDSALRGLSQPAFNQGAVGGMQQFAAGGMPRFLSGGGDGMSDDIPAKINGKQEARLADGEFVVPADVVSHLGNGSSKAGAKQLYSMMDKVRSARTGTKKQGKQINPRKYLAA